MCKKLVIEQQKAAAHAGGASSNTRKRIAILKFEVIALMM
jgi:hypothetical protein